MSHNSQLRSTSRQRSLRVAHLSVVLIISLILFPEPMVTVRADFHAQSAQQATGSNNAAQGEKDMRTLELSKTIEREMAGGQAHYYQLTLAAGQYLHVVVEQRGIDLVVTLFAPDGKQIIEVDSPNGTEGPEPVSLVAETSGNYRLEVHSLEKVAPSGRYEIKIVQWREATARDRSRANAEMVYSEGELLKRQRTRESLRKAIEKYQESLPHWRALGEPSKEATTLSNIGSICRTLSETEKTLDYYNQALRLWQAAGDQQGQAYILNEIGAVYTDLREHQKALDHYTRALPLRKAAGDQRETAVVLNNIGFVYSLMGEWQKAIEHYNQALPLRKASGNQRGEASTLNNIGLVYDELGDHQNALDYYNQALQLRRAVGDRRGIAISLNNIGLSYNLTGESEKALDQYNQALQISRAEKDQYRISIILSNIGVVYRLKGEYQKALDYYIQALELKQVLGDRRGEAATLSNIGVVYGLLGEYQKALDFHDRALPLRRAVGDRVGEVATLAGIARVERDRGNLAEARSRTERTLDIIDSLRVKVAGQELRTSYFASMQQHYDFYVDLLMRLHQLRPSEGFDAAALQGSERARARSLLELLMEARADIREGIDPMLIERERTLQQQLNAREQYRLQLLSGKPTEEQKAKIEKELRELLTQFQEVEAQIRTSSPRYAALTQPQPLTLPEIQQRVIDADTFLLEYALGEECSFLWAVTQASITGYELPKRAEIEAAAKQVHEFFSTNNPAADRATTEAAAALSQMLLGPVAEQLGAKRLLIVADGALQYLPFGALPAPAVGGKTTGKNQPLIVEHEIVSLPSASTLAVLRRELSGRKPVAKLVAVLADPVFEKDDPRVQSGAERQAAKPQNQANPTPHPQPSFRSANDLERSARESGVLGFDRLRFSRREAEGIAALTREGVRLKALDFEANRATAMSDELGQYRIVHFATHGLLNSQHPELSGIVLSLVDKQGQPHDGFLPAHEVYNLKLNADLVVLSGCQTALGKDVRGEGLLSLTRGFMYAGAPRVVASLWQVSDKATADLMKEFYKGMLRDGLPPAAALRAAQVAMWKEKRAPYFWAAFVLQGEWK